MSKKHISEWWQELFRNTLYIPGMGLIMYLFFLLVLIDNPLGRISSHFIGEETKAQTAQGHTVCSWWSQTGPVSLAISPGLTERSRLQGGSPTPLSLSASSRHLACGLRFAECVQPLNAFSPSWGWPLSLVSQPSPQPGASTGPPWVALLPCQAYPHYDVGAHFPESSLDTRWSGSSICTRSRNIKVIWSENEGQRNSFGNPGCPMVRVSQGSVSLVSPPAESWYFA